MDADIEKLAEHAELTVKELESKLSRRGNWTTGKKKWELKLLFSAYEALGIDYEVRKFGLDKIENIEDIQRD